MSNRTRLLLAATVSVLALSASAEAALLWDSDAQGGAGYYTFNAALAGNYTIAAAGANGGSLLDQLTGLPRQGASGGTGAGVSGTFNLAANTLLRIVVGGPGGYAWLYTGSGAGGGGGSFVWYDTNTLLAVGGGGGGAGGGIANGGNASATPIGGGAPGTGGPGSLVNPDIVGGGGGGGASAADGGPGGPGSYFPGGAGGLRYGLQAGANGGTGPNGNEGNGGFGGGGGGGGGGGAFVDGEYSYYGLGGGGGGGGWGGGNGGSGGYFYSGPEYADGFGGFGGGGGGSFLRAGALNPGGALGSVLYLGAGRVQIFLEDAPQTGIPEPASMGLFGLSLAGLALARRRRRK